MPLVANARPESRTSDLFAEVAQRPPWGRTGEVAWAILLACTSEDLRPWITPLLRRAHELTVVGTTSEGGGASEAQRDAGLLALALARATTVGSPAVRRHAQDLYDRTLGFEPSDQASLAFVTLAAATVLTSDPASLEATTLLGRYARLLHQPRCADPWLWPTPDLTELDGLVPDALLAAGTALEIGAVVRNGLALLEWRLDRSACRQMDERATLWEATTLLWAALRASSVTSDHRWRDRALTMAQGTLVADRAMGTPIDLSTTTSLMRRYLEGQVASRPVVGAALTARSVG